jgi:heme/copper-type cytochrome/quinol oxidase subunit 3
MSRPVVDVSALPTIGFGHRSIVWWGTVSMMAIEGTMFALVIATYLFLKGRAPHWPPGFLPPALFWGTLNTAVLLASAIPNQFVKSAAEKFQLRKVQFWMVVCLVFALAFNVIRIFEFRSLNVWWDSNAYGSVTWALLGFHTVHIVTDFVDSTVLTVLMFTGPLKESHFVDASESAVYWYFVVFTWLPIYALIYFGPRLA